MTGLEYGLRMLVSRAARWVIRRTDHDAPPAREWPIELLAEMLADQARKLRLERAGLAYEELGAGSPFADLPDDDKRAWRDAAQAMVDLGWGPDPV